MPAQAITTRTLPATKKLGARVRARDEGTGVRVVVPWDHSKDNFDHHKAAVDELLYAQDMGCVDMIAGGTEIGYVFVFPGETIQFKGLGRLWDEFVARQ